MVDMYGCAKWLLCTVWLLCAMCCVTLHLLPDVRYCHNTDTTSVAVSCRLTDVQWNLSIKGTLNKEHLSNEDTVCCPNHIYPFHMRIKTGLNPG